MARPEGFNRSAGEFAATRSLLDGDLAYFAAARDLQRIQRPLHRPERLAVDQLDPRALHEVRGAPGFLGRFRGRREAGIHPVEDAQRNASGAQARTRSAARVRWRAAAC